MSLTALNQIYEQGLFSQLLTYLTGGRNLLQLAGKKNNIWKASQDGCTVFDFTLR